MMHNIEVRGVRIAAAFAMFAADGLAESMFCARCRGCKTTVQISLVA